MGSEPVEYRPQFGFVVGQGLVVQAFPAAVRPTAWCSPLPTSTPQNTAYGCVTSYFLALRPYGRRSGVEATHPRYEETYDRPCPYQRYIDATRTRRHHPPDHARDRGKKSYRAWRP